MATTIVISLVHSATFNLNCFAQLRAYCEVDGIPLAGRGEVFWFADGAPVPSGSGGISTDYDTPNGYSWKQIKYATAGSRNIRAALNDPTTPISNTVAVTWANNGNPCPVYTPSAPVLAATPGRAWIDLAWTGGVVPYANSPPVKGWILRRAEGSNPTTSSYIDFLPPGATSYRDNGSGILSNGLPAGILSGVDYRYTITPWNDDSNLTGIARAWQSNVASATIDGAPGLSLDEVRFRTGA